MFTIAYNDYFGLVIEYSIENHSNALKALATDYMIRLVQARLASYESNVV